MSCIVAVIENKRILMLRKVVFDSIQQITGVY